MNEARACPQEAVVLSVFYCRLGMPRRREDRGAQRREGPRVLEGVMKDLRTQEPAHRSPPQTLPWTLGGSVTCGTERASEGLEGRLGGRGRLAGSSRGCVESSAS